MKLLIPGTGCARCNSLTAATEKAAHALDVEHIIRPGVIATPVLAVGMACGGDAGSVVLSRCNLSSVPLIVGFISGQGRVCTSRAFGIVLIFAGGILLTIVCIGVVTAEAGRRMGDVGRWGNYAVAGIFLVVGLNLPGAIPLPWSGSGRGRVKRKPL